MLVCIYFPPCRCSVILYEHLNFGGRSLTVYGQISHLGYHVFDDIASSAEVIGPCDWIFYVDEYYHGDPCILAPGNYPSSYSWGTHDNDLTSLRALPPNGTIAIALFEHNFEGPVLVLYESHNNLQLIGFDDQVSSAVVTGGSWCLYEHADFTGSDSTFPGPGHYTGFQTISLGDDRLSSVKLL